eukprot:scaffold1461_cov253-Pinguiococcus_pyrenoidosus.AAC.13
MPLKRIYKSNAPRICGHDLWVALQRKPVATSCETLLGARDSPPKETNVQNACADPLPTLAGFRLLPVAFVCHFESTRGSQASSTTQEASR